MDDESFFQSTGYISKDETYLPLENFHYLHGRCSYYLEAYVPPVRRATSSIHNVKSPQFISCYINFYARNVALFKGTFRGCLPYNYHISSQNLESSIIYHTYLHNIYRLFLFVRLCNVVIEESLLWGIIKSWIRWTFVKNGRVFSEVI